MAAVCKLFYIVVFTSLIGSVFTVFSLLTDRVFRLTTPLWAGVLGMALYVVPVPAPGLFLISPREQTWVEGYLTACALWCLGVILSALYRLLKILFAQRAAAGCLPCGEERIQRICARCAAMAGLRKIPEVLFCALENPACVTGVLRPRILLNRDIAARLTEGQLTAVLEHEVMHIKRGHMLLGRIYDCVCILNWMNPFVWVAKKEFDILCENDCDRNSLAALRGKMEPREYAMTMARLLELSAAGVSSSGSSLSASGYLTTKRRMILILKRQSEIYRVLSAVVLLLALLLAICFSVSISRGYFYPYPAYSRGVEKSLSPFIGNREKMENNIYGEI